MADTWKLLKSKQKARITDIMFQIVCDAYKETGQMPSEDQYENLVRSVYAKCNTRKITFEDLLYIFAKKQGRFAERIEVHGLPEPKPPKIKKTEEEKRRIKRENRKRKLQKRAEEAAKDMVEQDDYFAYIAGYTTGGAPYGITWEEMELLDDDSC